MISLSRSGIIFLTIILCSACTKKTTLPKAGKPEARYLFSEMEIKNEKYLSTVNIPVSIPVKEIENQINSKLNGLIYEDNSYEDDDNDNLKAKVWKLGDIKIEASGSTLFLDVPLKIWVSAGYKVSPLGVTLSGYKDTEFSMKMRFASQFGLSPDWVLVSKTMVESYDWIKEPQIRVAGVNIPIKSMVSRMLRTNMPQITEAIDEQVAKAIEIKKQVAPAWSQAQQPVLISPEFDTWLILSPVSVEMTPFKTKNKAITTTLSFKGYTQTITSAEKPLRSIEYLLPQLKTVADITDEFRIGILSFISYKEAGRMAEANFKGKKFSFSGGKYNIEVNSVEIYGQGEKLVIKAGLQGSVNGTVYLKGVPHYDLPAGKLSLRDLDFDLSSRNMLIRAAGWLLQGKFARTIEQQLVFPAGEQIETARKAVQQSLHHKVLAKGIELNGNIEKITPDKIYLTPEHIYAVVFAEGKLDIKVDGLL